MANDLAELRALVLTMAPMVFAQEGLSAENVEALGAAFAKQIQGINIAAPIRTFCNACAI